jgi:hypothetical protein
MQHNRKTRNWYVNAANICFCMFVVTLTGDRRGPYTNMVKVFVILLLRHMPCVETCLSLSFWLHPGLTYIKCEDNKIVYVLLGTFLAKRIVSFLPSTLQDNQNTRQVQNVRSFADICVSVMHVWLVGGLNGGCLHNWFQLLRSTRKWQWLLCCLRLPPLGG